jgi:hypothetical protein
MTQLATHMAKNGFWDEDDAELMRCWVADLKRVGYSPPPISDGLMNAVRQQMEAVPK